MDDAPGWRVWPLAALNEKTACVISLAVENTVIAILIEFPLRLTCTPLITGAAGTICAVVAGAGVGGISVTPAWSRSETVIVPETVPVCTASGVSFGNLGVVLPAKKVKVAVVPPEANWMVLSTGPES